MRRHLSKTDLCVIANCGHLPNEERPEEFNREVLRFLLSKSTGSVLSKVSAYAQNDAESSSLSFLVT